jgi:isopenicillin-N N-acyltransferase like protein
MSLTSVDAQGSWREIGRSYGEALRDEIQGGLDAYEQIAPSLGGTVPELLSRVARFAEPARPHAPARVEELVGMAEGAGIRLEQALLLNCIEELTEFEACTTAASGRFLVHAEMWYPQQTDVAVLVAAPAAGPAFIAVSCAGFLTGVGASSAGFAQGVQSTFSTDARVGVPRVMVSRDALCAADVDRAIREACNPHRAGGYGYVIASADGNRIIETSGAHCEVFEPSPLAAHTNHYLSTTCAAVGRHLSAGSAPRLAATEEALREGELEMLEDCQHLLSTSGFQATGSDSATIFAMACDVETGRLCISDGDPRDGRWEAFDVPRFRANV